jgi:hypothetical protein
LLAAAADELAGGSAEQHADLGMFWEAPCVLLREQHLRVGDDVELTVAARLDLGLVLRL